MSGHANIPAQSQRKHETGLVWLETITNGMGPINVKQYTTIRIRAAAPCTITLSDSLGGSAELACSLASGEIIKLNVGPAKNTPDMSVTVTPSAAIYLQEGKQI